MDFDGNLMSTPDDTKPWFINLVIIWYFFMVPSQLVTAVNGVYQSRVDIIDHHLNDSPEAIPPFTTINHDILM